MFSGNLFSLYKIQIDKLFGFYIYNGVREKGNEKTKKRKTYGLLKLRVIESDDPDDSV